MAGHVLIATPTAGAVVTSAYTTSLVNATRALHGAGVDYNHSTFDGADIVMARNYLANLALIRTDVAAVLWIDSDMAIPAAVFNRLLQFSQPMVGVCYSQRTLDLETYVEMRARDLPPDQARAMATQFNVRITSGTLTLRKGFCEVDGLGFGCVLTRRDLLQELASSGIAREVPSGRLQGLGLRPKMYDFFGEIRNEDGSYLSEDYSFCARVGELGKTVWALVDVTLGHVGKFEYGACFQARLEAQKTLGR